MQYEEIHCYDIHNNSKKVNTIVSDNARHFRNDISILIRGYHFELDTEAKNDLIALAKDIEYYLSNKYNC